MNSSSSGIGPADKKYARDAWTRALTLTGAIDREVDLTMPLLIERLADRFDAASALESTEGSLTYAQLARRCHQYARWGLAQGLRCGDVAALLMPNRAEYLAVWLGLGRIGVTVALLNTHVAGDALLHSIAIVAPRLVVVGAELASALIAVRDRLPKQLACWVHGSTAEDLAPLAPELSRTLDLPLSAAECALPALEAAALYIYTSGTTGLPKAAKVSHYRLMRWSHWFAGLLDTGPQDRMYDCLPLYHSVGGVVATGATLVGGGAVVIRPRFSVSDFWRDIRAERCTLFQYIGELCRYLVNAPASPAEGQHALRLACGNGLRPEVWDTFKTRFRIPRILEYYASTEGNFSLYNCEGRPGAIGRIPPFLTHRLPVALLRYDVDGERPRRDTGGFCERCATDEVGEAVGLITADSRAGRFEGYADAKASAAKVLHDVFTAGDAWYRTGDLMRRDADGFYHFVDRVGDTYRWKGENVSTAEVLSVLTGIPGVLEGVVFGVTVPGSDGRAGMAALVVDEERFDRDAFGDAVERLLPPYARPVFLRLVPTLAATGTFKPIKRELAEAGYDPAAGVDPLFFREPRGTGYVPLDRELHRSIEAGMLRL